MSHKVEGKRKYSNNGSLQGHVTELRSRHLPGAHYDFEPTRSAQQSVDAEQRGRADQGGPTVLITVLMPCLNEAKTLAACIQRAHTGCEAAIATRRSSFPARSPSEPDSGTQIAAPMELSYEVLIADNGSTDGSQDIAIANEARVVRIEQKGYGAALTGGIAAARGKYVVMGDSDSSYDFGEVSRFLDKIEEGHDLVMGNRFAGGIMPGAMPWHHRYIGNPLLSAVGRWLYRTPCRDWHCGLRAFDRERILALKLASPGMEFASEMVISAAKSRYSISEIPTTLSPDGRDRPPHLRSFRDGARHLSLLVRSRFDEIKVRQYIILASLSCVLAFFFIVRGMSAGPNSPAPASREQLQHSPTLASTLKKPWDLTNNFPYDLRTLPEFRSLLDTVSNVRERLQFSGPTNLSTLTHHLLFYGPSEPYRWNENAEYLPIDVLTNRQTPEGYRYHVAKTRFGARFPLNHESLLGIDQSNTEAHSGQTAVSLAYAGRTLDTVLLKQPELTLQNVIDDLRANVTKRGEVYWEYLAIILFSRDATQWRDKFGNEWNLDRLAEELMARDPNESPCGGTHGLISLAVLANIDLRENVLSKIASQRLMSHLGQVASTLEQSQRADGGWDFSWNETSRRANFSDHEIVMVTGHHLEWLMLLPRELQPSEATYTKALMQVTRLLDVNTSDKSWIEAHYCPSVHATRSIYTMLGASTQPLRD